MVELDKRPDDYLRDPKMKWPSEIISNISKEVVELTKYFDGLGQVLDFVLQE